MNVEIIRDSTPKEPIGRCVIAKDGDRRTVSFARVPKQYEGLSALLDAMKAVSRLPELDTETHNAYRVW